MTAMVWARSEFPKIKTALHEISTCQSEWEIIIDRDTRRIKVRLDTNPAAPGLDIIQEGKPDLAPDPITGGLPQIEMKSKRFDAIHDGGTSEWIEPGGLEPLRTTNEIATLVREWVGPA